MRFGNVLTKQWLYSLEPPVIGAISLALALWLNYSFLFWIVPVFIFLILPILDYRSRDDRLDPEKLASKLKPYRRFFEFIVRGYMPIQYMVILLGVACLTHSPGLINLIGLVLSVGIINGIAIAPAHELNHSSSSSLLNRMFSVFITAPIFYGHFLIEHNAGHHTKVATPEDPASARMGENFWAFAIRSIALGFLSAVRLECARIRSARQVLNSKMIQGWTCSLLLLLLVGVLGGPSAVVFFIAQAVVGMFLLEAVNYIEHYGLLREKVDGVYVPCTHQHSWNSNKLVSNIGLFNLQRHSDHHANPTRPYEMLRHIPDSPQHPTGYAAMIMLALVPPLWFRVMNPRVIQHYKGDITKINLK